MKFSSSYKGKRVLVTGDTGFKGSWLAFWLQSMGAQVSGYALPPEYEQGPFVGGGLKELIRHTDGDVRDYERFARAVSEAAPDVIFHLAAQPLVVESYNTPRETMDTNIMGTVNLLESVRRAGKPCAVVVVTSDKCYENRETERGYIEADPMGGHDVYSASKGCAELVVSAYRRSFFTKSEIHAATARAGNVIGPGDWAANRIVPDCIRSLAAGEPIRVRNPQSVRPWQHVLEPLSGYLLLGSLLLKDNVCADAWNFGPEAEAARTVGDLVDRVIACWGSGSRVFPGISNAVHEAGLLTLNIDKAMTRLKWRPVWNFDQTVAHTVTGYRDMMKCAGGATAVRAMMAREIAAYEDDQRLRKP
ncbi:MAG: CDP-glucose 4,6-dehydratase [Kiritimatiellia bacterium]